MTAAEALSSCTGSVSHLDCKLLEARGNPELRLSMTGHHPLCTPLLHGSIDFTCDTPWRIITDR